jgi:hypothetical protein
MLRTKREWEREEQCEKITRANMSQSGEGTFRSVREKGARIKGRAKNNKASDECEK